MTQIERIYADLFFNISVLSVFKKIRTLMTLMQQIFTNYFFFLPVIICLISVLCVQRFSIVSENFAFKFWIFAEVQQ